MINFLLIIGTISALSLILIQEIRIAKIQKQLKKTDRIFQEKVMEK